MLLQEAARRGILGGEVEDHLVHSRAFAGCVRDLLLRRSADVDGDQTQDGAPAPRARLADVGSGAGVPGLVIAAELAGVVVTLIERREARATWLEEAAAVLARDGAAIEVRCADVYDVARGEARGTYDVVTARAFGTPAATAELGGALVRVGGALVVSEPPDQFDRWRSVDLAALGLTASGTVERAGVRFQPLIRQEPLASRFPRRRAGAA